MGLVLDGRHGMGMACVLLPSPTTAFDWLGNRSWTRLSSLHFNPDPPSMRIGVMLRHLDQHPGGVKAYTRHLINALLARRDDHEYVFFYHNASAMGSFGSPGRVREMALPWRSRILWDQVAVPLAARRAGDRRALQSQVLDGPRCTLSHRLGLPRIQPALPSRAPALGRLSQFQVCLTALCGSSECHHRRLGDYARARHRIHARSVGAGPPGIPRGRRRLPTGRRPRGSGARAPATLPPGALLSLCWLALSAEELRRGWSGRSRGSGRATESIWWWQEETTDFSLRRTVVSRTSSALLRG